MNLTKQGEQKMSIPYVKSHIGETQEQANFS